MSDYDPMRDAYRSWELALASMREIAVRCGDIKPRNKKERGWAKEGEKQIRELETVKA